MKLGFDESGSGKLSVLVHGFPVDGRMWASQLDALSSIRRVISVDLRGRRSSPAESGSASLDDYATDIAETVESLGERQADLVGLSMGGYVLFALHRLRPDLFRSIVLVDTKSTPDPPEAQEGRVAAAKLARERGTIALAEGLLPKILAPSASQDVKDAILPMIEQTPGETAAMDAIAMKDRPDSTPDLARIACPALVIHGEQDQLMPVEGARQMAAAIPGAKFVSIPGAGHFAPMENPEAVNDGLLSFLNAV